MFKFLKLQYEMGKITSITLEGLVGKRITAEEYAEIVGGSDDE